MLKYLVPMIFGFIVGCVTGYFTMGYMRLLESSTGQIIGGIFIGGIFGALIGSISGEVNASQDQGGHRLLLACLFGGFGGFMGATKMEYLWITLKALHLPHPPIG
jgi:hypothetical protein